MDGVLILYTYSYNIVPEWHPERNDVDVSIEYFKPMRWSFRFD